MLSDDVLDYLSRLPESAHVLLPFENTAARDQALLRYIREAISQNKMVIHLCENPERDKEQVLGSDMKSGRPNQLRITAVRDIYTTPLSVQRAVGFWRSETEIALKQGFSGLAESADGTSVLSEDLMKFEEAVGRSLSIKSMTALCLYDARRFVGRNESLLIRLLSLHGHVIFPGIAGRMY